MDKPKQIINLEDVERAAVHTEPFPYAVIPNFIKSDYLSALVNAFPDVSHRGSIPVSSATPNSLFQDFINEFEGSTLRDMIAQKFSIDLNEKPTMTTLRGYTSQKDGRIHIDSKDKLITVLLYMNSNWSSDEGKLRLLKNNHSLDDYVEEISPLAGTCLIFKVTPNCWHGHKPFVGKRLSLQLNYLTHDVALTKHLNQHRFSATIKRFFPWLFNRSYY